MHLPAGICDHQPTDHCRQEAASCPRRHPSPRRKRGPKVQPPHGAPRRRLPLWAAVGHGARPYAAVPQAIGWPCRGPILGPDLPPSVIYSGGATTSRSGDAASLDPGRSLVQENGTEDLAYSSAVYTAGLRLYERYVNTKCPVTWELNRYEST